MAEERVTLIYNDKLIKQNIALLSVAYSSANIKRSIIFVYVEYSQPIPFGISFKYAILYEHFVHPTPIIFVGLLSWYLQRELLTHIIHVQ